MKNTYAIPEKMTADTILSILRNDYALQCRYDPEVEPDMVLTFDSSVEDWRWACDLVKCKPLGRAMNEIYHLNYSDDEWFNALEPSDEKKLKDVCELMAKTAIRPSIKPLKIAGVNSVEAGVFIALRTALRDKGINIDKLRPSTPIHPDSFDILYAFCLIAPEKLPEIDYESHPFWGKIFAAFLWLVLIPILLLIPCAIFDTFFDTITTPYLFLSAAFGAIMCFLLSKLTPYQIYTGELKTVGDLCRVVACDIRTCCPQSAKYSEIT